MKISGSPDKLEPNKFTDTKVDDLGISVHAAEISLPDGVYPELDRRIPARNDRKLSCTEHRNRGQLRHHLSTFLLHLEVGAM